MNVAAIAALAHLDLDPGEASALERDLGAILDYVGQLAAIETAGVEPMAQPLPAAPHLREDVARPGFTPAEALANAPAAGEGMFEVPKIIDRG